MGAWLKKHAGYLAAGFAILAAFLALIVIIQAVDLHQKKPNIEWGDVAGAFGAVATVLAVGVALWQSVLVRQQAKADAKEAAARLERELTAANERHQAELAAQRELSRAEVENQIELARVQRVHLREQEFKQAIIRVGRAANAYTHELATLVEQGRRAAKLQERQAREDALLPISKQLGGLVQDVSNEISGGHMLTRNDALHEALNDVNAALMLGPYAEMEYRNAILGQASGGPPPSPKSIFDAMEAIQNAMGDARQLAGDLLSTGWE